MLNTNPSLRNSITPFTSQYNATLNTHMNNLNNFDGISMLVSPPSLCNIYNRDTNIDGNTHLHTSKLRNTFSTCLYLSAFCFAISVSIYVNLGCGKTIFNKVVKKYENSALEQLREIRISNPKKVIMGHLNINSIPNKLEGIMGIVGKDLDIFLISERKIDDSFPETQFSYKGYSKPHRKDRKLGAGGLLLYINENIPSRELTEHTLPDDVEIMCVEINLKKQKWVLMGIYRPLT